MADSPIIAAVRPLAPNHKFTQTEVDHLDAVAASFRARAPQAAPVKPTTTDLTNPAAFFDACRDKQLLGKLSQSEVDGVSAILAACGHAGWSIGDTAYALGTAFHETAGTMQPIKEYGGPTYFKRMYDIEGARPAKARELGNLSPGDGAKYCGRGYVQLTGRKNYTKADKKLHDLGILQPGESLVDNPELAMRAPVAAAIMVYGMREGWFTGRDLDDDIPRSGLATLEQFVRSRDIINGTDKADQIAREAMAFQAALQAGGWGECSVN
jgi:putative chitinase